MIEMDVRQEDIVDVGGIEPLLVECIEQQGHAVVRARVDKCSAAALDDKMAGVLDRPQVLGIDGDDAIVQCRDVGVFTQVWSSRGP